MSEPSSPGIARSRPAHRVGSGNQRQRRPPDSAENTWPRPLRTTSPASAGIDNVVDNHRQPAQLRRIRLSPAEHHPLPRLRWTGDHRGGRDRITVNTAPWPGPGCAHRVCASQGTITVGPPCLAEPSAWRRQTAEKVGRDALAGVLHREAGASTSDSSRPSGVGSEPGAGPPTKSIVTSIRPPLGVNLMALASRFHTTRCSRPGSPRTIRSSGGSWVRCSSRSFDRAAGWPYRVQRRLHDGQQIDDYRPGRSLPVMMRETSRMSSMSCACVWRCAPPCGSPSPGSFRPASGAACASSHDHMIAAGCAAQRDGGQNSSFMRLARSASARAVCSCKRSRARLLALTPLVDVGDGADPPADAASCSRSGTPRASSSDAVRTQHGTGAARRRRSAWPAIARAQAVVRRGRSSTWTIYSQPSLRAAVLFWPV